MGTNYKKIKFPCGYEYELYVKVMSGYFNEDRYKLPECPLHGKKCKSQNRRVK